MPGMRCAARAPPSSAAAPNPAVANALKADLAAAKRREDELSTRLAALEAELGSLRGAKADLTERVAELTERLQVRLPSSVLCLSFFLPSFLLLSSSASSLLL